MTKSEVVAWFRSWLVSMKAIDVVPEPAKSIAIGLLEMATEIVDQSDNPVETIERIRAAAPWLSGTEKGWQERIDQKFGKQGE